VLENVPTTANHARTLWGYLPEIRTEPYTSEFVLCRDRAADFLSLQRIILLPGCQRDGQVPT